MINKFGLAAIVSLCAAVANAQTMPTGVYADGGVELSYFYVDDTDTTVSHVDFTLGYDGSVAGGMPIGFEIGVDYIRADTDEYGPIFNGAIFYDSTFGRISVGAPLNAMDDYVSAPKSRLSSVYLGGLAILTNSYTSLIQIYEDVPVYGVRFDGSASGVSYGVSYHNFDDGGLETLTLGANYAHNNYVVSGGYEQFLGEDESSLFGSIEFDFGLFGSQVFVSKPFIGDGMFYQIEGSYAPFESVELLSGYASYAEENLDYYYVQAEYSFLDNGYIGATYSDGNEMSALYDVYVGWRVNFGS